MHISFVRDPCHSNSTDSRIVRSRDLVHQIAEAIVSQPHDACLELFGCEVHAGIVGDQSQPLGFAAQLGRVECWSLNQTL